MSVIVTSMHPSPSHSRTHRPRSTSNSDGSRPPPRYSSLAGALPPSAIANNNTTNSLQELFNQHPALTCDTSDIAITDMRPPRYSSVFQRNRRHRQDNRADEAFGSDLQTHEYHLKGGSRSQPWATLKVLSKSSTKMSSSASALSSASGSGSSSSQKVAKFTSGDLVQGSLELNLESPQNINSINLSLRGRIITSSYEGGSYTFLEQSIINWTRSNGDPRSPSPEPSSGPSPVARSNSNSSAFPTSNVRTKKYDGKLSGDYAWPFAFSFPSEVSMPGTSSSTCPAPQTFVEKGINGTVQYELVLRMTHGMLRSDSKLLVNIVYVPDVTPPPSSVLRQLAYGENMGLPGPEVDPIGWHTLPPALVRGKLFNERNVKLQCTLSIANPQSYTRGAIIPCHLTLQSNDRTALDVLANPKCLAVRLIRRVQYPEDAARASASSLRDSQGRFEDVSVVEKAVWWVPGANGGALEGEENITASSSGMGTIRSLEGEIHLDKDMQPSCDFPLFKVAYELEVLPPRSPAFMCSATTHTTTTTLHGGTLAPVLISTLVTIATLHSEGPAPVAVTKPKPRKERSGRSRDEHTPDGSYTPNSQMMMINFNV
ncbi:unnamed protein product [Cyclocybe aegerita]|uniref:Arrestin-like N-terminal domain-containing protein n=1 Tax=Cyclocybe aegerita TaxID=1973307 RepID=A0A8S0WDZ6_CYCAE|nr:unnamed protein product [Cyclocybe aegerita]